MKTASMRSSSPARSRAPRQLCGWVGVAAMGLLTPNPLIAQNKPVPAVSQPRARDLGIPFDGTPGQFNAITDVKGVEVGYKTLISGEGKLVVGKGPVRTGVTAILPRGKEGTIERVRGLFFWKWKRRYDRDALD